MPAWQAWIFWSLAGLLALAGAWLMLRSLALDRARGRRRCPKCWYDMSHTAGLTCSECGHTAPAEKRLLRTRRHWRLALLGFAILLSALPAGFWPSIRQHGWAHLTPTTILIYMVSKDDLLSQSQMQQMFLFSGFGGTTAAPIDPFAEELLERIAANSIWDWQLNLLIDRHLGEAWPKSHIAIKHEDAWPANQPFFAPTMLDQKAPAELLLMDVRVRLRPRSDPDFKPVRVVEQWPTMSRSPLSWTWAKHLGDTGATNSTMIFDVLVERRHTTREGRDVWHAMRTATLPLPVNIRGRLDDYVTVHRDSSVNEQLRGEARIIFDNVRGGIFFDRGDLPSIDQSAVPVRIELLRDGDALHSWEAFVDTEGRMWTPSEWPPGFSLEYPGKVAAVDRPFGTANYRDYSWSVRLTGLPSFAILAPDELFAWEGSFTTPLNLVESRERLYLTSEPTSISQHNRGILPGKGGPR